MKDFIFKLFDDIVCVNLMLHSLILLELYEELITTAIKERSVCLSVTAAPVSFQCFLNKTNIIC